MTKNKVKERKTEKETSEDEESGLEEEIEESELKEIVEEISDNDSVKIIDDTQFQEFLQPSTSPVAPVLERIADEQAVGWIRTEGASQQENEKSRSDDDPFKYNVGETKQEDEPKYTSQSKIENIPKRIDMSTVGRNPNQIIHHEAQFTTSSETSEIKSPIQEKYFAPEKFDRENVGKENIFDKKIKQYEIK